MGYSSSPSLLTRNWLLCMVISLLGILFLTLCLNQSHQLGAILYASSSPPTPHTEAKELVTMFQIDSTFTQPLSVEERDVGRKKCDMFDGRWVFDPKTYPLYRWHQCPFLDAQVNCRKNGRPDSGYEHWRWEARGCTVPRFNGSYMLERMRGKRVAFIGDSLNRNQWESLACLLYRSLQPRRIAVQAYGDGNQIFRALDCNFTLEFFWSPFLVPLASMRDGSKVLKLDKVSKSARQWRGADIMVFNTGHWWTHTGRMRMWKYFELKGNLAEQMETAEAFGIAMKTWAQWIDQEVDATRTTVFFRSFSPEHKRESLQWCHNKTHPSTNETYIQWFPKYMASTVERTIEEMRTPVKYLNITRLSEERPDAHTDVYTVRQWKLLTEEERRKPEIYADCSHWCLPGLPDTWNELLYASLFGSSSIAS